MSRNVFFMSDPHFGHSKITDGTFIPKRPFKDADEMDQAIIDNCNSTVKPEDKLYILGDVAISKKKICLVDQINCRKTLILGNHDIFNTKEYLPYFDNIRAIRVFDGFIATHIPIHPDSLGRFKYNVHGHTHFNSIIDERYINVCVEKTNYRPIELSEILKIIKNLEI